MKKILYTIKDNTAGIYGAITEAPNGACMSRDLDFEINQRKNPGLCNFIDSLSLYEVGSRDDQTGKITAIEPKFIANLIDYQKTETKGE